MEIILQNKRKDYNDFINYYYFKRDLFPRTILPLLLSLLISYNFTHTFRYHFWQNFLAIFILLSGIYFLFLFLLPYFISQSRLSRRFKTYANDVETIKISLFARGINIETTNENNFWEWEEIKFIYPYTEYILLRLYNNKLYLLPKSVFQSAKDAREFFDAVQTGILKVRPQNVRRLYNRGWLGLIPLVGAFVGFWLIGKGASAKHKDRKLIFIGIGAIMFTVFFYSSMFYYFKYSEQFRKNTAPFSRNYLNSLIKDIEFYKSQKGHYPESLEELSFTDKMVMIHDPILSGGSPNNGNFYYKRIGEKYTLFSCGIDRIPNTPDDIFPSMNNLDSSKIGFIRTK